MEQQELIAAEQYIVDAHTHIFPPEIIDKRELFAKRDSSFGYIYGDPNARMATGPDLIKEMDSAGVDSTIVCGFPWRSTDMCRHHNDYMAEMMAANPDRIVGLATVNPVAGNAAETELARCFDMGLKGVGEISADAQGFGLDDLPIIGRVAHAVMEADLFLLLHVNEEVGHFYPGKTPTTAGKAYRFLEEFPQVTTILAHWGGGLLFYELMPEVREIASNAYYDTAASPFLYRPAIYRAAVEILGEEKILFGSDYPLLGMTRHLDEIRGAGLSESAVGAILGENAARLPGVKAQQFEQSE